MQNKDSFFAVIFECLVEFFYFANKYRMSFFFSSSLLSIKMEWMIRRRKHESMDEDRSWAVLGQEQGDMH